MRFIDKEALMKSIQENPAVDGNHRAAQLLECIMNAPTIDAVPVVHGRWVYGEGDIQCSICGHDAYTEGDYRQVKTNYCPNCGACMDKEDAE